MAEKGSFLSRLLRKSAQNFYVTVSPRDKQFTDIFYTGNVLSFDQMLVNFETIPQLFAITNYVTDKIANIPVKVVGRNGKDKPNSELNKLIESPNHYQSFVELIKLFFSYYELSGNGYLYGIRPDGMRMVTELYCLPTEKTEIVLARDKTIPAWMNEVSGYLVNIGGMKYNLDPSMVLHEKYVSLRYNDGSWVYGMSKYIPGERINRELKAIHDAKTSIIEKRGALGFISNESENPDPEQSKAVKEALSKSYGLLDNQDKVTITTEKLKWQQMSLGIAELQLIENAKYSFATLCQINGFDPVIFSTEGSTFANKATAERDLMLKVLKPKVDNIYKQLSIFCGEGYSGDQIIADWSKVEELQDDRGKMTDMLIKQIDYAIITPYEAAEMLYGREETENAPPDEYFMKSGLKPLAEAGMPDPNALPDASALDPDALQEMIDNSRRNGN